MNSTLIIIIVICLLVIAGLVYYILQLRKNKSEAAQALNKAKMDLAEFKSRYSGIINTDEEIAKKKRDFSEAESILQQQLEETRKSLTILKEKYRQASYVYEDLTRQNELLKDNLEIAEFGVYEPHFDYETSEIFKEKISDVREQQKNLIKEKSAVTGGDGWLVNNSAREGKKMSDRQKKLMLRAFNGECDGFISNVRWNNEKRMEERIRKSVAAINKTGETHKISISPRYVELKRQELRLTHEYKLKKQEEKELQRQIREQMREEEKARRDFEKALKEAKKEEDMLQKALEKAQAMIAKSSAEEKAQYESQLAELQAQLKVAEEKNQRAISMAQQTKSGHVYVISNLGSFGENVFKIGMTRRLDPMDRVLELGDASVPFRFDVHAMIYSENAPELENQLHKAFEKYRLNFVNRRREYFNISLDEIANVVKSYHGEIEFIIEPEAKEYRESQVIREQMNQSQTAISSSESVSFPDFSELFAEDN